MREFECPWCGRAIDAYEELESDIWEEGTHDIECPACGMHFNVETEHVVRFDVDVWDAMRPCDDRECGFYSIDCCTAGDLDPNLEPPEGVPAWCPRLKGGRK